METIRSSGEFRIHNLVTVCADCRRNGVAGDCMHAPRPPWKDAGQQMRKAAVLMQGDEKVYNLSLSVSPFYLYLLFAKKPPPPIDKGKRDRKHRNRINH